MYLFMHYNARTMYDLIIVGGGPAGASAAVYAARKQLKTLMIVEEWGGQSAISSEVQNWIGTPAISGADLAASLQKHAEGYRGEWLEIKTRVRATALQPQNDKVVVTLSNGEQAESKTVLVSSGANRRKLEVPGAAEYDQKGLTYCASCDGPLFEGKDVAIIGGGNAAFETALQLLAYCKNVTLINRSADFRADEITIAAALAKPTMHVIKNAQVTAVSGEQFVTGLTYKVDNGPDTPLAVEGIFVEIGLLPNTTWVGDVLEKNEVGQIIVDPRTQRASHPRVWAAGDCTSGLYHQNNIAAGDAVKALEDIYLYIHKGAKLGI